VKQDEVKLALIEFIREEFLWGDDDRELTETTPLLEWGIIDSLRTALLITHIREGLGVFVSPAKVNARNFRDVTSIAALVVAEAATADTNEKETA
jgi:clorobiocin biosynthesis protein CloN5